MLDQTNKSLDQNTPSGCSTKQSNTDTHECIFKWRGIVGISEFGNFFIQKVENA